MRSGVLGASTPPPPPTEEEVTVPSHFSHVFIQRRGKELMAIYSHFPNAPLCFAQKQLTLPIDSRLSMKKTSS